MNPDRLFRQVAFLREVEKLKGVTRANRTLDGRNENAAEHSWHVALMALLLQQYAQGDPDMLKVTKMLLLHDIVEIDAGDTWLYSADQGDKAEAENRAAERLFAILPADQGEEYRELWREFENRRSAEARFAAVVDGIQPMLNHLLTGCAEDGVIDVERVRASKSYIEDYAPRLWPLVEDLLRDSEARGLYV